MVPIWGEAELKQSCFYLLLTLRQQQKLRSILHWRFITRHVMIAFQLFFFSLQLNCNLIARLPHLQCSRQERLMSTMNRVGWHYLSVSETVVCTHIGFDEFSTALPWDSPHTPHFLWLCDKSLGCSMFCVSAGLATSPPSCATQLNSLQLQIWLIWSWHGSLHCTR